MEMTALSRTTVSSCEHRVSKYGRTSVCCAPNNGLHNKSDYAMLVNSSVIANTTSSSSFLMSAKSFQILLSRYGMSVFFMASGVINVATIGIL